MLRLTMRLLRSNELCALVLVSLHLIYQVHIISNGLVISSSSSSSSTTVKENRYSKNNLLPTSGVRVNNNQHSVSALASARSNSLTSRNQRSEHDSSKNFDSRDLSAVGSTSNPNSQYIEAKIHQRFNNSKVESHTFARSAISTDDMLNADDQIPLATMSNNHNGAFSQHSGSISRPSTQQYLDISGLVGRSPPSSWEGQNFSSIQVSNHNIGLHNASSYSSPQLVLTSSSPSLSSTSSSSSLSSSQSSPKPRAGLPECATQQVCNAIFVRMNYTQRLCECSSNYKWKCSNTLDPQDGHTIELTRKYDKRIYTQIKTCEPLREVRACKSPSDWTLLALQSERSGKAHYVVVCKCPTWAQLEGPYTHNHPPYANIPGIRVFGMLCVHQTARSSAQTYSSYMPSLTNYPEFPWSEALSVANSSSLLSNLDSY